MMYDGSAVVITSRHRHTSMASHCTMHLLIRHQEVGGITPTRPSTHNVFFSKTVTTASCKTKAEDFKGATEVTGQQSLPAVCSWVELDSSSKLQPHHHRDCLGHQVQFLSCLNPWLLWELPGQQSGAATKPITLSCVHSGLGTVTSSTDPPNI